MRDIAGHIEYLLRRHDCVVIPGWGALLCDYVGAHFENSVSGRKLLPPSRRMAFNSYITASDGKLIGSVARKERIGLPEAELMVEQWVKSLSAEVRSSGSVELGRLGRFFEKENGVGFEAYAVAGINGAVNSLPALSLETIAEKEAALAEAERQSRESMERGREVAEEVRRKGNWRAYATGVVASLAVIVTAVMFALSPIKVDVNTQMAALVPTPAQDNVKEAIADEPDIEMLESQFGVGESMTLPLAPEDGAMKLKKTESVAVAKKISEPTAAGLRFNTDDRFCVVVASFPSRDQADTYMAFHKGRTLGVLAKDGKYRVYAATARTREAAEKSRAGFGADSWICSR